MLIGIALRTRPASRLCRQIEALRVEPESLVERSKIDTEVGRVASVNAVFVARCTFAPGLHTRTRRIRQLLAEECIEFLERRERVLLERREVHVEKAMIP